MDSFRDYPSDFEPAAQSAPAEESGGVAIGGDERRMHVRAYNYWVSLLNGRDYPSIEDLEPESVSDFAANSVLLDYTAGRDDPVMAYVGAAVREECGIDETIRTTADVPSRSLLSRLTDHYMQIIANRAPVGFEAEFVNQRGVSICYRGILMPFSSDGDTIDFIYGVINWKTVAAEGAPESARPGPDQPAPHVVWDDGPSHEDDLLLDTPVELPDDAGLADRLSAAREGAEVARSADGRSRTALYRALALAFDFAEAAEADPEDYAELLRESGLKAQARAPMTPIVKLVFGVDYDKARLTEFAAALCYARRQGVGTGGFLTFIEGHNGGLKALVAAERQARRPAPRPDDRAEQARSRLRQAQPLALQSVQSEEEFLLVLARRCESGGVEAVAIVDDAPMVDRAIRRSVR